MALPDFFLLGAPKAGTTALHAALARPPASSTCRRSRSRSSSSPRREPRPPRRAGPARPRRRAQRARVGVAPRPTTRRCSTPRPLGALRGESTPFYLYDLARPAADPATRPGGAAHRRPARPGRPRVLELDAPVVGRAGADRRLPSPRSAPRTTGSPPAGRRSGTTAGSAATASSSSTSTRCSRASRCTCCATATSSTTPRGDAGRRLPLPRRPHRRADRARGRRTASRTSSRHAAARAAGARRAGRGGARRLRAAAGLARGRAAAAAAAAPRRRAAARRSTRRSGASWSPDFADDIALLGRAHRPRLLRLAGRDLARPVRQPHRRASSPSQ